MEYPALFLLLVFGSLTFLSTMMVRHAYVELKYEKDFHPYHHNAIHRWFRVVVWSVIFAVFGVSSENVRGSRIADTLNRRKQQGIKPVCTQLETHNE